MEDRQPDARRKSGLKAGGRMPEDINALLADLASLFSLVGTTMLLIRTGRSRDEERLLGGNIHVAQIS